MRSLDEEDIFAIRCDDLLPPKCDDDLSVSTGHVEPLPGLRVKYWRYTPSYLKKGAYPILVINGGPGLPHNYAKPTRSLACDGREVAMYDQAGTGASWLPDGGSYPEIFDIRYYAQTELPALIEELGWTKFHIVASSWGTQIAFQFATHHFLRDGQ